MKELKAMAASYGRSALAGALAVYMTGETDPKKLAYGGYSRWDRARSNALRES
jgi:hypothetical protein